jgi:hypothetical protein
MASAGPAAADWVDSLPRWRAAAGLPAPTKQEGEAGRSRRGATGRCLLHDAATAASASITQRTSPVRAAACGGVCRRCR